MNAADGRAVCVNSVTRGKDCADILVCQRCQLARAGYEADEVADIIKHFTYGQDLSDKRAGLACYGSVGERIADDITCGRNHRAVCFNITEVL